MIAFFATPNPKFVVAKSERARGATSGRSGYGTRQPGGRKLVQAQQAAVALSRSLTMAESQKEYLDIKIQFGRRCRESPAAGFLDAARPPFSRFAIFLTSEGQVGRFFAHQTASTRWGWARCKIEPPAYPWWVIEPAKTYAITGVLLQGSFLIHRQARLTWR